MDFSKCRLKELSFKLHHPLNGFEFPGVIVYEAQSSPRYYIAGELRGNEKGGQISLTCKGKGAIKINDTVYDLLPNTAFIHSHSESSISYFYPQGATEDWEFLWIDLYGGEIDKKINSINTQLGYLFELGAESKLEKYLKSFLPELGKEVQVLQPAQGANIVHCSIEQLLNSSKNSTTESKNSEMIIEVQKYIDWNITSRISVKDIANKFNISREHLSRTFQKTTGKSIQNYIYKYKTILSIF